MEVDNLEILNSKICDTQQRQHTSHTKDKPESMGSGQDPQLSEQRLTAMENLPLQDVFPVPGFFNGTALMGFLELGVDF